MEEKYQQFLKYNFESDVEWKAYLRNLDPPPRDSQLVIFKKKYYKRKIDSDFDISYVPSSNVFANLNNNCNNETHNVNNNSTNSNSNINSNTNNINSGANNNNSNTNNTNSSTSPSFSNNTEKIFYYMYFVEIFFYLYFFYSILFSSNPFMPAMYGFALRLIKITFPIQLNKQYLQKLIQNDTFYFLIYSLIMSFFSSGKLFIYLVHPAITSIIFIFGFYRRNPQLFPKAIETYINKARSYQDRLIQTRLSIELLTFPITVIGIFFGFNSMLLPAIYYQFLKMKISVDNNLNNALLGLRNVINNKENTSSGIFKTIWGLGIKVCDLVKRS